jgi:TetR/AcrR family transcriptional regulator
MNEATKAKKATSGTGKAAKSGVKEGKSSAGPSRRKQERTLATQAALLRAATELFVDRGFDGVTLRDVENRAEVHRGLASYHFGDKESLWKRVVSDSLNKMRGAVDQRQGVLSEIPALERLRDLVRFYVRFSARHPEVSALVSHEARQKTWRLDYLIDNHMRPAAESMAELAAQGLGIDESGFVHWYYLLISASSTIFYFEPECEQLFGTTSRSSDVVEKHAQLLTQMLVDNWSGKASD